MASNQTANYGLNQWAAGDRVLREEFNQDNAKRETALNAAGNCRIIAGSYVGTGTYGESNPCHLEFLFRPQIIFMDIGTADDYNSVPQYYLFFYGAQEAFAFGESERNILTWSDTGVSWYFPNVLVSNAAMHQFNASGKTYRYLAIG